MKIEISKTTQLELNESELRVVKTALEMYKDISERDFEERKTLENDIEISYIESVLNKIKG